jgi:hypothetical protein
VATTAIREVPNKLAYANFYLDDILEIQEVFKQAYLQLPNPPSEADIRFQYIVGGKTRITTIEELLSHSGSVTHFSLEVFTDDRSTVGSSVFTVDGRWSPRLYIPYGLGDKGFDVYGRLQTIALERVDRVRTYGERCSTFGILTWFGSVIGLVDTGISAHYHHNRLSTAFYFWLALFLIDAFIAYGYFKPLKVFLTRHRQDTLAKSQRRQERWEKLGWLVAGVVFGALGTLLTAYLTHRLHA